jgi:hypothetical protein
VVVAVALLVLLALVLMVVEQDLVMDLELVLPELLQQEEAAVVVATHQVQEVMVVPES